MKHIWNSKFIFANVTALFLIKTAFIPSGFQFAALLQDPPPLFKENIVAETNALRLSLKLAPLKENTSLDIAAAQKLQDMIEHQYFAHFSPQGVSPWHWFQVNKYAYTHAGENLAIGFLDAASTVDAWSKSASHRRNLIDPSYQEIGIAAAQGTIKDMEGIIVVQLFGTPAQQVVTAPPPKSGGLSLGLSRSAAQAPTPSPIVPSIVPSPAPSVLPTPVPSPSPILARVTTPTVPGGGINDVLTRVDTADPMPAIRSAGKALNNTFIIYSFIIALAAIVFLIGGEVRREFLVKAVFHLVIFALAAWVPLLTLARAALIL